MGDGLKGKVALVTGASRGIGRAIAVALAESGADVAVTYRSSESAAREVCEHIRGLGRRAVPVRGDLGREAEVTLVAETVRQELGPITILVNNAGIGQARSIDEISEKDWDTMLAVNLKAPFLITQAVVPDMRAEAWGRIIFLSSVASQMGGIVGPHYAASKGGIVGLMHYYAANLAGEGITANAISPGPVVTDMIAQLQKVRQFGPENIPVGRFGTPEEVAQVAVLLARNGYITGQTVGVNGGRYLS